MMDRQELFNDRLLRYDTMVKVRRSEKQKNNFIGLVLQEIMSFRDDVLVSEFKDNTGKIGKNVYIGDIDNAKTIVATYYDTPLQFVSNYYFDDKNQNRKNTLNKIWIESGLYITSGIALFFGIQWFLKGMSQQWYWSIMALFTFVYFVLFKRIVNGRDESNNFVRNTSTIVQMIDMMQFTTNKNTAYAFVDYGSNNELGLHALLAKNSNAMIVYLDSVNTNKGLLRKSSRHWEHLNSEEVFNKEGVTRVVSGEIDNRQRAFLNKDSLKSHKTNENNFEIIKRIVGIQEDKS